MTGIARARVHQWDGKKWKFVSDLIDADQKLMRPMVEEAAEKYAQEKNLTHRRLLEGELKREARVAQALTRLAALGTLSRSAGEGLRPRAQSPSPAPRERGTQP